MVTLFPHEGWIALEAANEILRDRHYLGTSKRGFAYCDDAGVMVFANPSSRRLPSRWLELVRWCIVDQTKNAGSMQWSRAIRRLRADMPEVTTVVSYSDPSVGHTGALYRATNWFWAPTWHRLRPPPSGHGEWSDGRTQSVKDRWVFPIRRDPDRVDLLRLRDDSILRRDPSLVYREPGGVPYRRLPSC